MPGGGYPEAGRQDFFGDVVGLFVYHLGNPLGPFFDFSLPLVEGGRGGNIIRHMHNLFSREPKGRAHRGTGENMAIFPKFPPPFCIYPHHCPFIFFLKKNSHPSPFPPPSHQPGADISQQFFPTNNNNKHVFFFC